MKKKILIPVLSAFALSTAPALAQQAKPASKSSQTTQEKVNVAEFDKQAAQIRENMKKLQEEMDKIRQTRDPKERQKLLEDHWTTMQSTMGMMRGLWGPGMMGGPGMRGGGMMGGPGMHGGGMMGGPMMGWQGAGGYYSKLTPEQLRERQYMSDQYMDLHYMMMEQMMLNHQMWRQVPR
ncbi:hypothetical protein [Cupriavidus pinatubonensis]|uniref:Uncharacterized protein n=1 Tax=Cupriavidus pinatubonensis TaxID=248026 RepID=A0ABM8Y4A8_9BURK|nr:hypothetical protein [Cupriavidus pinatubonensis]CAG9187589.1 hypothetical protein LMG23994_07034 [Cupriavidus pinatubonensis]